MTFFLRYMFSPERASKSQDREEMRKRSGKGAKQTGKSQSEQKCEIVVDKLVFLAKNREEIPGYFKAKMFELLLNDI